MSRIEDFKRIVSLRSGEVVGYRNTLIMLYSYHYRLINEVTVEELIKVTKEFNKSFREPYKAKELISVCRSVNRTVKHFQDDNNKGYKSTNKYIINALELEEQEQRKLLTIISTGEKYRRKNEKRTPRNEEGLTPKQAELKELKEKIIYMKKNEIKNKDISEQLNIPVKTLERYITKFKKEGLL